MLRHARAAAVGLWVSAVAGCIPNPDRPPYGARETYAPPVETPRADRRDAPRDDQRPYEPDGGRPHDDRPDPRLDAAERRDERVAALPAPPPAWQARPVTPDARTVATQDYVVRSGDTLRTIAERTGAGSEAIARANGLAPPFPVRAGERLAIPAGRYHLVRPGETGIAIARAYGVPWSQMVGANGLAEPYTLRAGMRIVVPGGDGPRGVSTAAERAAAFRLDIDDLVTGSQPAIAENARPAPPARSARRVLAPTEPISEPTRLAGGFAWPVHGRIVARFGAGASGERFNGVKIAVPTGTPIRAAADGIVAYTGSGVPTLGGLVILKHGDGWTTVYGHASRLLVQRGQAVKRGETIALSGDTGFADRPELHFEVRKGRAPVDPQRELGPI